MPGARARSWGAWLVSSLLFGLIHLPTYDWNFVQCNRRHRHVARMVLTLGLDPDKEHLGVHGGAHHQRLAAVRRRPLGRRAGWTGLTAGAGPAAAPHSALKRGVVVDWPKDPPAIRIRATSDHARLRPATPGRSNPGLARVSLGSSSADRGRRASGRLSWVTAFRR